VNLLAYPIRKDLIPGLPRQGYRFGVGKYEGVVVHSTAVLDAPAKNHVAYFKREWNKRKSFVHFFVDWNEIVQTADINYKAWGAGQIANQRYVHIELCETRDRDKFLESYKRLVWLTAWLLYQRKLGVEPRQTLWTHNWVSKYLGGTDHVDPDPYFKRHGMTVDQFVRDVKEAYESMAGKPTLKRGDKGDAVKELQGMLHVLDYNVGPIDGIFGEKTEDAVRKFQAAHKLVVDGIVGPKTWAALEEAVKRPKAAPAPNPAPKPAPAPAPQGPFKDVPATHPAKDAIEKVKKAGIMIGKPDGTFGLGESVKREELAIVIARLLQYLGK